jgi:hypothetical protein
VAGLHSHPSGQRDSADIALYVLDADGQRQQGLGGRVRGDKEYISGDQFLFVYYPGVYGLIAIGQEALLAQGLFTTYRDNEVVSPLLLDPTTTEEVDNWLPPIQGTITRAVTSPWGSIYLLGNFESDHGAISLLRLGQDSLVGLSEKSTVQPLSVYPNPARAGQPLTLTVNTATGRLPTEATFELRSLGGGARVQSGRLNFSAGKANFTLPPHLAAGAYLITLHGDGQRWIGRLICP